MAEGCDAGCAFVEAIELAFAPDGAAFACSLEVVTLVPTVFLAVEVLSAESCASPVAGDKQRQRNARTQGAPKLPIRFFARCFGSNGKPPKSAKVPGGKNNGPGRLALPSSSIGCRNAGAH